MKTGKTRDPKPTEGFPWLDDGRNTTVIQPRASPLDTRVGVRRSTSHTLKAGKHESTKTTRA